MHDLPTKLTEPPILVGKPKGPIAGLIITNVLLLSLIDILLIFVIPVFRTMYTDFGAKIPSLTKWAIYWSAYTVHYPMFEPLAATVIGGFLLFDLGRGRSAARRWLKYSAILTSTLFVVLLIAMFAPIFEVGSGR